MSRHAHRRLRVCLLHPARTAIGSRSHDDPFPALDLLAVGGPLLDDGFDVRLVDADRLGLDPRQAVAAVLSEPVDVVVMGHPGASCAHRTVLNMALRLKRIHPRIVTVIVIDGVHPGSHWRDVLEGCRAIDFVLCREVEPSARDLLRAIERGDDAGLNPRCVRPRSVRASGPLARAAPA